MNDTTYRRLLETVTIIGDQMSALLTCSNENENDQGEKNIMYMNQKNLSFIKQKTPEELLKNVFGYDQFRPLQKHIITNVLEKKDTLAVMPTGGGKSLCYQIPALMMEGLTIVISPLISLMEDQIQNLQSFGIDAAVLNSTLTYGEYISTVDKIMNGGIKLLYVSPEGFNTDKMQSLLSQPNVKVSCITIDESHCISEYGHDFRPDYLEIAKRKKNFPDAVCLALTATATARVQQDIVKSLGLKNAEILTMGFDRPNIYLEVNEKKNGFDQIKCFLDRHKKESGIIYCFSRNHVDKLTAALLAEGYAVTNYHAGLSDRERREHQKKFIYDEVEICVATVAFGMGINKPDVRFVIHYDMPKSLEQYYQEIGRSGRDGLPATALLLYSQGEARRIKYFLEKDNASPQKYSLVDAMENFAAGTECRRRKLLSYFGETYTKPADENYRCCDCCSLGIGDENINGEETITVAEKLRSWRKETARKQKVPPYVIFGDRTLMDIAEKRPLTVEKLLGCYGIGAVKSEKFGDEIIRIVKSEA